MRYATPTLTLPPQGGGNKSKDTVSFYDPLLLLLLSWLFYDLFI